MCVNLPLLLIAFYFDTFVPLALASLGVSAGACVLAAAQANLPRSKQRFWSRPLVALLFLLQPLVRGWARFKWRLNRLSGQADIPLEPLPGGSGWELPETAVYWSGGRVDRYRFLNGILSKLEQLGWSYKADTGWSSNTSMLPPPAR